MVGFFLRGCYFLGIFLFIWVSVFVGVFANSAVILTLALFLKLY